MSSMEVQKRKRVDDGKTNARDEKPRDADGGLKRVALPLPPPDEEVEEFFAIVKRIRVALKYFQRRDAVRCAVGEPAEKPTWSPTFQREDFDGVKTDPECSHLHRKMGLDLNSNPVSDGSDSV